ncbi:translocation protein sec66 [Nannizzia gypsea CBS 118893]|uniref:Translocation protein sec66 n=1 Tax=Arthroderma gypseum (strain ATCC MYA-4604 / CBS 118893) TaxID=535722 RepID=E4UXG8_ARTGP|nr:translocation protein sec66 [Nannizzia gypsea CBS 118893]EFR01916.1 translocation protein sec66 [Nannizzia gypsea CBS 118893]
MLDFLKIDWLSLTIPLAYLAVLVGSLATFSSLYRKRKIQKATSVKPWFPAHLQRDIYFSILHMEKKAPETVLKAALLHRAAEDIKRLLELRTKKAALGSLLQKGNVGDDLWQQFTRAEKEMEEEFRDVASEANAYTPGWGQVIFQSANEMFLNNMARTDINAFQATVTEEKEWWDRKRASIQEGFMKELEQEKTGTTESSKTKGDSTGDNTQAGSDEDTVLVDAASSTGSAAGSVSGGGKKKKKGKK